MRNMLYIIWGSLCLLLVISGCKSTDGAKAPVSLTWKMGAVEVQPGYYENSFVLKNISDVPLEKDWIIYYSQLPREILQEESAPVKVEVVNANFFRMYPAENFQPLAPGDSLTVKFCCTNGLKKMSHAPEGTYWVSQSGSKQGIPLPVGLTIQPLKGMETEDWYPAPDKIYASNLALETTAQLQQTDIFPSVKEAVPATGKEGFAIENKVKLTFHPDFANKLLLKGISKKDVADLKEPVDYTALCKLAVDYSDGVIQQSEHVNEEVIAYARQIGKPVLGYQSPEIFADACNDFYDQVWGAE